MRLSFGKWFKFRFVIPFFVALLGTTAALWFDQHRSEERVLSDALQWARLVSSQAEGMAFHARAAGERDPLAWAISFLSQGVEPRVLEISKLQGDINPQTPELYSVDAKKRVFEYSKVTQPESGIGIRIQIHLGYLGFLGSRTSLGNDVSIAFFFGVIYSIALFFGFLSFRAKILDWVKKAKPALAQLGGHIRDMVRGASQLATAASRSHETLVRLHQRIHSIQRFAKDNKMTRIASDLDALAADADEAFLAYTDIFNTANEMDAHITKTRETLIEQAKLMQGLNAEIGLSEVKRAK